MKNSLILKYLIVSVLTTALTLGQKQNKNYKPSDQETRIRNLEIQIEKQQTLIETLQSSLGKTRLELHEEIFYNKLLCDKEIQKLKDPIIILAEDTSASIGTLFNATEELREEISSLNERLAYIENSTKSSNDTSLLQNQYNQSLEHTKVLLQKEIFNTNEKTRSITDNVLELAKELRYNQEAVSSLVTGTKEKQDHLTQELETVRHLTYNLSTEVQDIRENIWDITENNTRESRDKQTQTKTLHQRVKSIEKSLDQQNIRFQILETNKNSTSEQLNNWQNSYTQIQTSINETETTLIKQIGGIEKLLFFFIGEFKNTSGTLSNQQRELDHLMIQQINMANDVFGLKDAHIYLNQTLNVLRDNVSISSRELTYLSRQQYQLFNSTTEINKRIQEIEFKLYEVENEAFYKIDTVAEQASKLSKKLGKLETNSQLSEELLQLNSNQINNTINKVQLLDKDLSNFTDVVSNLSNQLHSYTHNQTNYNQELDKKKNLLKAHVVKESAQHKDIVQALNNTKIAIQTDLGDKINAINASLLTNKETDSKILLDFELKIAEFNNRIKEMEINFENQTNVVENQSNRNLEVYDDKLAIIQEKIGSLNFNNKLIAKNLTKLKLELQSLYEESQKLEDLMKNVQSVVKVNDSISEDFKVDLNKQKEGFSSLLSKMQTEAENKLQVLSKQVKQALQETEQKMEKLEARINKVINKEKPKYRPGFDFHMFQNNPSDHIQRNAHRNKPFPFILN